MLWSVTLQAVGDRAMSHEEIVELADAVAGLSGVASGIGTQAYGAQIVVEAEDQGTAIELGSRLFTAAAARAGLPPWPISAVDALSELDDEDLT
jgi:hypothetical protein